MTDPPSERGRLILAVDGGNSKTDLALLNDSGRLLSLVRGGPSNTHRIGLEACAELLERLLKDAADEAGLVMRERPVAASAQILLAGADLPEELATLRNRLAQMEWSDRLVVGNDTLALLRAGTDRGWGIAVVFGAGSNCVGLAPDGREARFLALGPISGDWGGGEDVGLAALAAAVRSADGRGPASALEAAVPAHFGMAGPLEVSRAVHLRQIPRARLGELAPIVFALTEDAVAAGIVSRLTDEVVAFAAAALRRLELTAADPDVVLGGGLLRGASTAMIEQVAEGVHKLAPGARVVVSPSEPIVGAALLALDAIGADAGAGERARSELDAAVGACVTSA